MCRRVDNGTQEKTCSQTTGFASQWCDTCKIKEAGFWEKPY